ncbi:syntaxin-binding protein 5 isoform X2 [Culicoides brevitarsis]|uniref:syntaxin-binding protein 5 isoform X2 n=1 Tax=Culicoides brevitarsis TaxID=469753 RepID=UPI00307B1256
MKKFTFKGVLDGFRSSSVQLPQQMRPEQEIQETLRSSDFSVKKTFRHGFPNQPTALAYDPVQKLLAVGDKAGSLRILGKPGVDAHVRHDGDPPQAVVLIRFLVNEGQLVTATADDTIHLWNFKQKSPVIVQSLKFQRERITFLHLAVGSKWLYVGTEKGNIHVVNTEAFSLSGYIINWNKTIDLISRVHPGSVVHLSDNPLDANKLLIGYECGLIVLWDMRAKSAELRWQFHEPLRSAAWHFEGKHFVTSHTDGSLCTWPLRSTGPPGKPQLHVFPHAKPTKDGKLEQCKPIHKVDIKTTRVGETLTIFSGGLSMERGGKSPCITVLQGKQTTVLEMEHPVVDFVTICESPWDSDMQEPYAVAVLLQNDLVVIDLLTPGFPPFESPYPMDLHESPVTCCTYMADCPSDLVPAFYAVGRQALTRRTGYSDREWPVAGGEWEPASISYSEIIITGHQDGTIKFWDASAGTLQILYKLKTAKIFERPRTRSVDGPEEDPLAIQIIYLCAESRRLCVAGNSGHVILFKFRKLECTSETTVLEILISYESYDDGDGSPECEFIPKSLPKQTESTDSEKKFDGMLKVKPGPQKKLAGFQPQLVCLTPWQNGTHPGQITSLCINSSYGLMAYGNEYGLVLVDIVQKCCLLNIASPDLYGAQDPYARQPRSPKRLDVTQQYRDEQARSPSIDQLTAIDMSPSKSTSTTSETTEKTSSRPVSPGVEATEESSLQSGTEDKMKNKEAIKLENSRRKSMSWKGKLTRQLSSAQIKIISTFKEPTKMATKVPVMQSEPGTPIEHRDMTFATNELEVPSDMQRGALSEGATAVPSDCSNSSSRTLSPNIDAEYLSKLEQEIVTSLEQAGYKDEATIEDETKDGAADENIPVDSSSDSDSSESPAETPTHAIAAQKKRTSSNPSIKRVEFSEEVMQRASMSSVEGARVSRPSNLELQSTTEPDEPVRPPRQNKSKATDKRNDRLLSVPNLKMSKQNLKDLRSKSGRSDSQPGSSKFAGNLMRRFNKLDSSFSRSRSSSMSSLENITSEAVTCLAFTDSYTKKSDPSALLPTLWVGTSLGSVLTVSITLPDSDNRKAQPMVVSFLGGPIFRLKGSILAMSFLDCNGGLIPYSFESWRDENKRDRTPTKATNRMSPTMGGDSAFSDRQFIVITSEKQARVVALPSQNCVYRQQIVDADFIVKAEIVSLKDSVCLVCYASHGHLLAYTLPSLKPLLDVDFLPLADLSFQTKCKQGIVDPMLSIWGQQLIVHEDSNQISKSFCFSNRGQGLFLATPTEIQKFTICAEFCTLFSEMAPQLYMEAEMPEAPKASFLVGLFGGGTKSFDREELFGEASGKANRSVAVRSTPSERLQELGARASTAGNEISRAHKMMIERGEKLSQLEDNAERMSNTAQEFSSTAHQLMNKYKDKKWYQL